jgi:hypothetical protein
MMYQLLLLLLLLLLLIMPPDTRCQGQPSMQDFQQLLTDHTRQQIRLTKPIWLSEFKINERQVSCHMTMCACMQLTICGCRWPIIKPSWALRAVLHTS